MAVWPTDAPTSPSLQCEQTQSTQGFYQCQVLPGEYWKLLYHSQKEITWSGGNDVLGTNNLRGRWVIMPMASVRSGSSGWDKHITVWNCLNTWQDRKDLKSARVLTNPEPMHIYSGGTKGPVESNDWEDSKMTWYLNFLLYSHTDPLI